MRARSSSGRVARATRGVPPSVRATGSDRAWLSLQVSVGRWPRRSVGAAGNVGIVVFEAGALRRFDEIDLGSVERREAVRIEDDLDAARVELAITGPLRVVVVEEVLETSRRIRCVTNFDAQGHGGLEALGLVDLADLRGGDGRESDRRHL